MRSAACACCLIKHLWQIYIILIVTYHEKPLSLFQFLDSFEIKEQNKLRKTGCPCKITCFEFIGLTQTIQIIMGVGLHSLDIVSYLDQEDMTVGGWIRMSSEVRDRSSFRIVVHVRFWGWQKPGQRTLIYCAKLLTKTFTTQWNHSVHETAPLSYYIKYKHAAMKEITCLLHVYICLKPGLGFFTNGFLEVLRLFRQIKERIDGKGCRLSVTFQLFSFP